jgi:hypothetical protein
MMTHFCSAVYGLAAFDETQTSARRLKTSGGQQRTSANYIETGHGLWRMTSTNTSPQADLLNFYNYE